MNGNVWQKLFFTVLLRSGWITDIKFKDGRESKKKKNDVVENPLAKFRFSPFES